MRAINKIVSPLWLGIGMILFGFLFVQILHEYVLLPFRSYDHFLLIDARLNYWDFKNNSYSGIVFANGRMTISEKKDSANQTLIDFQYDLKDASGRILDTHRESAWVNKINSEFTDDRQEEYFYLPPGLPRQFKYFFQPDGQIVQLVYRRTLDTLGLELLHYSATYTSDRTEDLYLSTPLDSTEGITNDVLLDVWFEKNSRLMANLKWQADYWIVDKETSKKIKPWQKRNYTIAGEYLEKHLEEIRWVSKQHALVACYIPILLMILGLFFLFVAWIRKEDHERYRLLLPIMLFVGGCFGAYLFYFSTTESANFLERRDYNSYIQHLQSDLQTDISNGLQSMNMLQMQFRSQNVVDQNEFDFLAKWSSDRSASIVALGWVLLSTDSNDQPLSYPSISHLYPLSFDKKIWNNELGLDDKNKALIEKAIRSKDLVVGEVRMLPYFEESVKGIWVFSPVFERTNGKLKGVLLGVFDVEQLLKEVIQSLSGSQKLYVRVSDANALGEAGLIWSNLPQEDSDLKLVQKSELMVADRIWILSFYRNSEKISLFEWVGLGLAFLILICSSLITLLIYRLLHDTEENQHILEAKSARNRKRLKEKQKEIASFIFMISNELKIHLNKNLNIIDKLLIKLDRYIDYSVINSLKEVRSNILRRLDLIEGLLNYALLGNSKKRERLDLNVEFNKVQADLADLILQRNAVVSSDELPEVILPPFECYLFFRNLLHWIFRKTPESKGPRIHVNLIEEDRFWKLGVECLTIKLDDVDINLFSEKLGDFPEQLIYNADLVQMQKVCSYLDIELSCEKLERQGAMIWIRIPKTSL